MKNSFIDVLKEKLTKLYIRILASFIPNRMLRKNFRQIMFNDIKPKTADFFFSNPSSVPEAVGYLRDVQLAGVKILREVDRICKQFNIKYFISFGTLIGAVRNQKFIPWDDDIDISMVREDYKKFADIFNKNTIYKNLKAEYYNALLLKIRLLGTPVGFDIFSYDILRKNMNLKEKLELSDYILDLHKTTWKQFSNNEKLQIEKCKKYCDFWEKLSKEKIENLNENLSLKDSSVIYSVDFPHVNHYIVFDYSTIFPLKKIKFEGEEFFAPNDPDTYLTFVYGDYMKVPKTTHIHTKCDELSIEEIMKIKEFIR